MQTAQKIAADANVKTNRLSLFRSAVSKIAWLYDRFVFHVIYRGERLRPEIIAEMEKEDEDERNGKNVRSPTFTNTEDAIRWLDSDEE